MKKVAVIMGSDSDLDVVSKGIAVLDELGIKYEVHIYSAHRTPEEAGKFCSEAKEKGFGVIIAAAGMAAHLAGAAAAQTLLPVIGIPIESGRLGGLDARREFPLPRLRLTAPKTRHCLRLRFWRFRMTTCI